MTANTSGTSIASVTRLPTACIMGYQPKTLEDAMQVLDVIFENPYYAHKPEGERAKIRAHLKKTGLPDPQSYGVFAITHNGTRVDFDLKCLLLLGMIRLAHLEGDLTEEQIRPFVRNIAELYMYFGLREDNEGDNSFPETVRIRRHGA